MDASRCRIIFGSRSHSQSWEGSRLHSAWFMCLLPCLLFDTVLFLNAVARHRMDRRTIGVGFSFRVPSAGTLLFKLLQAFVFGGFGRHSACRRAGKYAFVVFRLFLCRVRQSLIETLHDALLVPLHPLVQASRGTFAQSEDALDDTQLGRRRVHACDSKPVVHNHPCTHDGAATIHTAGDQRHL